MPRRNGNGKWKFSPFPYHDREIPATTPTVAVTFYAKHRAMSRICATMGVKGLIRDCVRRPGCSKNRINDNNNVTCISRYINSDRFPVNAIELNKIIRRKITNNCFDFNRYHFSLFNRARFDARRKLRAVGGYTNVHIYFMYTHIWPHVKNYLCM